MFHSLTVLSHDPDTKSGWEELNTSPEIGPSCPASTYKIFNNIDNTFSLCKFSYNSIWNAETRLNEFVCTPVIIVSASWVNNLQTIYNTSKKWRINVQKVTSGFIAKVQYNGV